MKTRVLFSAIFAEVFWYFPGWWESCNLPKGKSLLSCILTKLLALRRAQTEGQLSKPCFSSSVFLALASENLVVTESSFKNIIC